MEEESLNRKAPRALRNLPGILTDHRDCPGSPGMSTSPSPFGAADRTSIRVNPLHPWLAFCCLQSRLNTLDQNIAIRIEDWLLFSVRIEKRMQSLQLGDMFRIMERITINPEQCGGRPCIRGMRIRVKDVLDMLAGGATAEEILADYPDLEAEDIRACLAYASRYLDHSVLVAA